jgi:hypothetical protein
LDTPLSAFIFFEMIDGRTNNMGKSNNVFVSHYNKDEENIQKLKKLLSSKGYVIKNSSIDGTKSNDASNSEYIKQLLRDRISWAGKFICLIGPQTHERVWVDWEIEQAQEQGKAIIGVYIQGARDCDVPASFEKYGDSLVGWTSEKIIGALNGEIINFENPDGSQRMSKWSPIRSTC